MSAPTSSRPPRLKAFLAFVLLLIPLVAGSVFAGWQGFDPARTWSSSEDATGAPAMAAMPELTDVRRAAGEAQGQAGFLETGAKQLADGTAKLNSGAKDLGGGVEELQKGAQALVDGMVQLQAGTGQLGDGATELANGVEQAVGQVVGLEVVRGQMKAAVDRAIKDLEGNSTPEAREAREQLVNLRGQIDNFELGKNITDPLNKLKDGSRDLANQLDVPGYGYHDGIYTATEGAKQLNSAIGELNGGVDEAVDGVKQLDDGAKRIHNMAQQNKAKVDAMQRALPPLQPTAGTAPQADAAQSTAEVAPAYSLSPVVAFLIAALAMLGGAAVSRKRWFVIIGGGLAAAAASAILAYTLAAGSLPVEALAAVAGVGALGALAAAMFARVLHPLIAVVLGLGQLALCALMLRGATSDDVPTALKYAADLMPMQWTSTGVTVLGNDGQLLQLWTALAVLGAVALIGWIANALLTRVRPATPAVTAATSAQSPDAAAPPANHGQSSAGGQSTHVE